MNDETLDELLSAALDGVATQPELALIAETPGAEERLRELRIAADAVSAMLPRVPTNQREAMIASAVASFEPQGIPSELEPITAPNELPANVVPMPSPLKRRLRSGAATLGAIAASVIVMVLLFNVVGSGFGGGSDDSADFAAESSDDSAAATTAAAEAPASLSAEAGAVFEENDGAAESTAPPATTEAPGMDALEAAPPTTIALSQRSESLVREMAEVCWEKIAVDFDGYSMDLEVDAVLENGLLRIPTVDDLGDQSWIVVVPESCLVIETLPRP